MTRTLTRPFLLALLAALLAVAPLRAQDLPTKAQQLNEQGVGLVKQGRPEQALPLFRQALTMVPKHPVVRANAARCLIELGDRNYRARKFAAAARDYHEAAELTPQDPAPVLREGRALLEDQQDRAALGVLERAVRAFPTSANAFNMLGLAAYRLGDISEAAEHFGRAYQLDPKLPGLKQSLERARTEAALEKDLYQDLGAAHFRIKYDGQVDAALGRKVAQILEQAYESVGRRLGKYPAAEVPVVIYPGRRFQAATGAHGWVAGLYDGKIRVPAQGLAQAPDNEVRRVLTHEYTHALLRNVGGRKLPIWLQEGFAQVAEGHLKATARKVLGRQGPPPLTDMTKAYSKEADATKVRRLYAASFDFVDYLLSQGGSPLFVDLLTQLKSGKAFDEASRRVYGRTLAELDRDWRATFR